MSEPDFTMGFGAAGEVTVEYGPLRLAAANYHQKDPADVTGEDIARFRMED